MAVRYDAAIILNAVRDMNTQGHATQHFLNPPSPHGMLWLIRQEDGDIIVTIIPDSEINKPMASVEFCSCGAGGGRSPKTLAALRALMVAMEEDNAERKI